MLAWKEVIYSTLFEYETAKVLQIRSWKIAAIYRMLQVAIVLYVSLWVMYRDKGYQSFDYPVSGVTAKLKGVAFANTTSTGARVWDIADIVVPPQQNYGFFVTTNMVITPNQTLRSCPESLDVRSAHCFNNSDCYANDIGHLGSGVQTGRCVPSSQNDSVTVCEVYGWCPTELDEMPIPDQPLLDSAPNFTVMLKNSINFPKFRVNRRNILSWMDRDFLNSCRYEPHHSINRFCPIFRLADLVQYSKATNQDVWLHGALMSIHIEWECNLDLSIEHCLPSYTFRRLDDFKVDVAPGWNFRYSQHYIEEGIEKRTLIKAYGIQCFITVSGRGRKFDPFVFSMNLGSGLALLGIASVLCDLIIIYIDTNRKRYKTAIVDIFSKATEAASFRGKQSQEHKDNNSHIKNNPINNISQHAKHNRPLQYIKHHSSIQPSRYHPPQSGLRRSFYNTKCFSSDCVATADYAEFNRDELVWHEFTNLSSSIQLAWIDDTFLES